MAKRTAYRSSDSGQFISKSTAAKSDPRTVEKEQIKIGKK